MGSDLIVDQNWPGLASTAVLPDGSFVVCWGNDSPAGSSQFQRFAPDGRPVGVRISLDLLAGHRAVGPKVDAVPGGGFVAMWRSNVSSVIEGQRFAADGSPLGGRFTVEGSDGFSFSLSVGPDGRMVVFFLLGSVPTSFKAQRLFADGTLQGAAIPVTSGSLVTQFGVALGPRGRFFVVWSDSLINGSVRGRLFAE